MDRIWLCSVDGGSTATKFCQCGNKETFLCDEHEAKHKDKGPYHPLLPIQAYGHHKSPGFVERYWTRYFALEEGKNVLSRNLELVDQCSKEVTQKFNSLIKELNERKFKVLEQLSTQRILLLEEIEKAVAEVTELNYADLQELIEAREGQESPYERQALRLLLQGRSESLPFSFQVRQEGCQLRIEDIVTFSFSSSRDSNAQGEDVSDRMPVSYSEISPDALSARYSPERDREGQFTVSEVRIESLQDSLRKVLITLEVCKGRGMNSNRKNKKLQPQVNNLRKCLDKCKEILKIVVVKKTH